MQGKKYSTEEERKEGKRIARKRWVLKNKEHIKDYFKEYQKEYTEQYREEINAYKRDYYANKKDGKWRVYLLPNIMYVGQTGMQIERRMYRHKTQNNDTTGYTILHICDSEQEARDIEAIYHDIGFNGKNPRGR